MKKWQKFFYNRMTRTLCLVLSLVCCVVMALSGIALVASDEIFDGDDLEETQNYAETSMVKTNINTDVGIICDQVRAATEYESLNRRGTQIYLLDYDTMEQEGLSIQELEQITGDDIMDMATWLLYGDMYYDDDGNGYSSYGLYNYSFYDFDDSKSFLEITQDEYQKIIQTYTDKNTRNMKNLPQGATLSDLDEEEIEYEGKEMETTEYTALTEGDYYEAESDYDISVVISNSYSGNEEYWGEDTVLLDSDTEAVPVYNSLDSSVNPYCYIRQDSEGVYTCTINAAFSDSCYIFQNNYGTFLYAEDEDVVYSSVMGWVPMDVVFSGDYLYIPTDYLDFSSQAAFEQSILLAPQFNSIVPVFFAGMDDEDYSKLSDSVYADVYGDYYDDFYYWYSYSNQDAASVTTNADDLEDVDADDYAECLAAIRKNCNLVVEYDGTTGEENSYYEDAQGLQTVYSFLSKNTLRELEESGRDIKLVVGLNVSKNAIGNENYWYSQLFRLCKMFSNALPVFALSFLGLILMVILLTASTGVVMDEQGEKQIRLHFPDRIPYEILLILICVLVGGLLLLFYPVLDYKNRFYQWYASSSNVTYAIMMVFVVLGLFAYFAIAETYLSLVRRVKNHSFVHDLLLVRLVRGIRRFVHSVTKRGKGATIVALRYTAIFAVNILVLVFLAASEAFYDNFGIFLLVLVVLILFDLYHIFRIMKYATSVDEILKTTNRITEGELDAKVPVEKVSGNCLNLAESINSIGDGLNKAVEISTRDERMKAELITNVSHDIKTPLTSIINYVDLIKREHIEDEKVNSYIQVLDQKSQRLKQLIEDLVEASKASTGNIELECMNLNLVELLQQTIGEFDDKFISRNLRLVADIPSESCVIYADGRRSFRIIENLFQNAYKYAMPGTRIYLKLLERDGFAELTLKNVSEAALNISPDELTERFVRGDSARTTEGSGLGLSIAKNLTELQGGSFEISIDGDLFRVVLTLPLAKNTGEADAAQNDSMQEA